MAEARPNFKYMDVARGLALSLVIISHANGLNLYLIFYYIQIFFIISGYVYRPGRSYGENIKKKAVRLLVPYFGYSALLWTFYAIIRRNADEVLHSLFGVLYSRFYFYKVGLREDPVSLLDIANGAMWYLTAFFVTALLFHLIVDKCLANWKITVAWSVALLLISMGLNELPILLPWSLDIVGVTTVLMLIGAWMRKVEFFEKKENFWMVAGMLLIYLGTATFNGYLNTSVRIYGKFDSLSVPFYMIVSVSGSVLCIWVSKWIQNLKIGKLLAYLGTHSMELICVHMVVLEVFEIVAMRLFDVHAFAGIAMVLYQAVRITVAVLTSLFAGWIIALLKQKLIPKKAQ
ncbi:MAG: acyltransferase [Clostridiales bacterium]|nr:acyltransferase [Roseburia sp.]MDD7635321.1 acyltransferase [Clostridiales bacterium]MDY4111843.1 acyltransferase [Roseburia sp.]